MDEHTTPHVRGECASCSFVFDLFFGLDCPRCHKQGLSWATYETVKENPYPHVLNGDATAHHEECPACEWEAQQRQDQAEIEYLYQLYKMEDPRV